MKLRIFITIIVFQFAALSLAAQTTEFSYQGSLKDGANAANGNYDFEFRLFDAATGGSPLGPLPRTGVLVTGGIFAVSLDFGSAFTGPDRYLEIAVRISGGGGFTTLNPRQRVASSPYSIKSISAETANTANTAVNATNASNATNAATANNALNLGGVAAGQYVLTGDARLSDARNPLPGSPNYVQPTDPRLTDARNPLPGSTNYVQNGTGLQANSNFNVSGSGTAGGTLSGNVVNAATQYNIGGQRILSTPGPSNTFAGPNAGAGNTTGASDSFFGNAAGQNNTTGGDNSFFGVTAGQSNTAGNGNSFFGSNVGRLNANGNFNSFFGIIAGRNNTSGTSNSFYGSNNGVNNTTGNFNTFVGDSAGFANTTASSNSFFGHLAGYANTLGSGNSFFGDSSGSSTTSGVNNAFFGNFAGNSNTSGGINAFFGVQAGTGNTTGGINSFFGHNSGAANTTGGANAFFGQGSGFANSTGSNNAFFGHSAGDTNITGSNNTIIGDGADLISSNLSFATAIGAGAIATNNDTIVLGRNGNFDTVRIPGTLIVESLGSAGATTLCRNTANRIATCSSSLRYKTAIAPFSQGLSFINSLRPISYQWKEGGMKDVGFGAEDVAKIDTRFVTYNSAGEVEGVKYDRLTTVFVNAFKEQQAQIETQQKQIERQRAEIVLLKNLVCSKNRRAALCVSSK